MFDRDYHEVKGYVRPALIQQLVSIMGLPSISVSQRVEYRDVETSPVELQEIGDRPTTENEVVDQGDQARVELPRFRRHNESNAEEEATMPNTHRPYAPESRQQMVGLVPSGRTPEQLAQEYEPSEGAIRNWMAQRERDAGQREDGLSSDERQDLRRLRREYKAAAD